MTTVRVEILEKLIPVFTGEADVRGAYGGRGSGKTRSFAKMSAVRAVMWDEAGREGIILCCRQFMNSLDDSSLEEVRAAIQSEPWLNERFDIGEKYIRTKSGRVSYKFSGLDRNIDSIKSKSRVLLCWIDEAEPVTETAYVKLIPTLREEDSELWVTWNPEIRGSATDIRFRQCDDPRYKVAEINWRDNKKFPQVLERQRNRDRVRKPDQYDHIWEGGYKRIVEGSYFAQNITLAESEGRIAKEGEIVNIPVDPLMTIRLFIDIGGTGAKADNFVIWAAQFIGQGINWINHYEVQGQEIRYHLNWLKDNGYTPDRAEIWLPHDGSTNDRVFNVSYESAFRSEGYNVTVIPNQGRGAATQRIEAVRKHFYRMYFDSKCEAGVYAISHYHEKKDEIRKIGLGPDHDWSSHSADAIGLGAICYDPPKPVQRREHQARPSSWMTS